MTDAQSNTSDITYRRTLINLLHDLKNGSNPEDYEGILTRLQDKLEQVPTNDYEQSTKFFEEITCSILSGLEDFYDIDYQKIEEPEGVQSDKFTLRIKEGVKEKKDVFSKYRNMERFINGFVQHESRDLWYKLRTMSSSGSLENRYVQDEYKNIIIQRNKIGRHKELFLPMTDYGDYIGQRNFDRDYLTSLYSNIVRERAFLEGVNEIFDDLSSAINVFDTRLRESLRREHIRFGITALKRLLSRIVVPVSLIEDEALRKACEESGRKVFIRRPTMEDLMPLGCSVHVYASHDLEDDSSYIAKPILVTEELPKDTEDLKYLGVGQFTHYDDTSERSLNGANPYIINHNVYVKALQEDFERLIPEELLEEITFCEELLQSNTNHDNVMKVNENDYLSGLIQDIENDMTLEPQEIIQRILDTQEQAEEQEEPVEAIDNDGEEEREYRFLPVRRALNLHPSFQHEYGILIVDPNDKYGALRKRSDGEYDLFTSFDCDECIKALGWIKSTYSVYDLAKLNSPRNRALKKFYVGGL